MRHRNTTQYAGTKHFDICSMQHGEAWPVAMHKRVLIFMRHRYDLEKGKGYNHHIAEISHNQHFSSYIGTTYMHIVKEDEKINLSIRLFGQ